jgi:hypothetical protein
MYSFRYRQHSMAARAAPGNLWFLAVIYIGIIVYEDNVALTASHLCKTTHPTCCQCLIRPSRAEQPREHRQHGGVSRPEPTTNTELSNSPQNKRSTVVCPLPVYLRAPEYNLSDFDSRYCQAKSGFRHEHEPPVGLLVITRLGTIIQQLCSAFHRPCTGH